VRAFVRSFIVDGLGPARPRRTRHSSESGTAVNPAQQ